MARHSARSIVFVYVLAVANGSIYAFANVTASASPIVIANGIAIVFARVTVNARYLLIRILHKSWRDVFAPPSSAAQPASQPTSLYRNTLTKNVLTQEDDYDTAAN